METTLIRFVAARLAAHDWEHSRHQEPEDFYVAMAEVAIRAHWEHEARPRPKPDYLEGVGYYRGVD